jgi:hypothetical protein
MGGSVLVCGGDVVGIGDGDHVGVGLDWWLRLDGHGTDGAGVTRIISLIRFDNGSVSSLAGNPLWRFFKLSDCGLDPRLVS